MYLQVAYIRTHVPQIVRTTITHYFTHAWTCDQVQSSVLLWLKTTTEKQKNDKFKDIHT